MNDEMMIHIQTTSRVFLYRLSQVDTEIFSETVTSKAYDCFNLACDFLLMLYERYYIIHGWKDEGIQKLESIIWVHNIRRKGLYGIQYSSENVEYVVCMPNVVQRHYSPDNYLCEIFERVIRPHKRLVICGSHICGERKRQAV